MTRDGLRREPAWPGGPARRRRRAEHLVCRPPARPHACMPAGLAGRRAAWFVIVGVDWTRALLEAGPKRYSLVVQIGSGGWPGAVRSGT